MFLLWVGGKKSASMSRGGAQMQWHEDFVTLKWMWHRRRCFYNTVKNDRSTMLCDERLSISNMRTSNNKKNDRNCTCANKCSYNVNKAHVYNAVASKSLMRWWNTACAGLSKRWHLTYEAYSFHRLDTNVSVESTGPFRRCHFVYECFP